MSVFVGIGLGFAARVVYGYWRYRTWDNLEQEVEAWKDSPQGRFHRWTDSH